MELTDLTIHEATNGLKDRKFSSFELVSACLTRIKKLEPKLNAFITVCEKEALEEAKQIDEIIRNQESGIPTSPRLRGTGRNHGLLGIPVALKDLYSTRGIRTTAASKVLEDYIPPYDATVVKKLKEAGVIIIGKTNHDAWGHGSSGENSDFGPTKNPWNLDLVPGGSSSGSGVAVAARECLASTATDTGGSIRTPAAFCGVVGLKPTYGRVSRYGIVAMASSLDSIGHFAKNVEDCALFLQVTAGHDPQDAATPDVAVSDYTENLKKGIKGFKIGVPKEYFVKGMEKGIERKTREALTKMEELGGEIIEVSLPHTEYALAAYYIIQPAEVSSNLARYDGIRYGNGREAFGDEAKRRIMLGTYTLSAGYYDAYYLKAMKVRTLIKKDFEDAFRKVDVIIAPVSPTVPWKLGEKVDDPLKMYLSDILTVTANLAGIPSLVVPCGFIQSELAELPVGIQIMGPHFSEELLFRVGYTYEQATEWHKKKVEL